MTWKPIWGTWGDFDTNSVLEINAGTPIDIYFTCSWSADEYNAFARKGAWVRLDADDTNLLYNFGEETWNALPEALKDGAKIAGADGIGVYAILGYKDYANLLAWDINVDLLEKYGYTLDDIKNTDFYGFGDILKTVKEGEGASFYPLLVEGAVLERMVTNTCIVTGDSGSCNLLSYYFDPKDPTSQQGQAKSLISSLRTSTRNT